MPSLAQFKPWSSVEQWLRSQGTSDDEIKRQKKLYWDATSQTTEMLGMAPEKLTSLQNNFLGTGEPGLLGTMWNAAKRGHLQAQLARQGTKAYIASLGKDEPQNAMDLIGPIADIAGTYKELERLPTPEVTKHVEQAKGLGDWLKAVKGRSCQLPWRLHRLHARQLRGDSRSYRCAHNSSRRGSRVCYRPRGHCGWCRSRCSHRSVSRRRGC